MLRKAGYDYRQTGVYFITICSSGKTPIFGRVLRGVMNENKLGELVRDCWNALPLYYERVELDQFTIMPNHVHGILWLKDSGQSPLHELPEIIRAFKSMSARKINLVRGINDSVWQRGYYDHIIRNEKSLSLIRLYIGVNPILWDYDPENLKRQSRSNEPLNELLISCGFKEEEFELVKSYLAYRTGRV